MPDQTDVEPAASTATPSPVPPSGPDPAAETAAFMEALLGYAPPELHALLWTLQDKRSSWIALAAEEGPQRVADAARGLADGGKDVYVAVSLSAAPGGSDTRIKSANAAGIFGLWADIDIADPDVHKKWNLPPSIDAALELLTLTGVAPTVVVHSGHGLQAWWLFNEFWSFDSEQDRLAAAGLAQRWNTTLQSHAATKQWVVDSTFDLARVMRVPGTLNRKGTPVVPVRLLSVDGPRYNPSDIEPYCRDEQFTLGMSVAPTKSYQPDEVVLDETLQPSFERFQALIDNDTQFELTWKMKRKDFTDQSPSSYDMSLATQAARAGWTDQEIAALLVAFRRTHKLDVSKALRPDYVRRTLQRARDGLARDNAAEMMEEVAEALEDAIASGDDEAERTARRSTLEVLGQQVGLEVSHFIKYLSDPPAYALVTPVKTIPLGGADGLLIYQKFRQSIVEGVDVLIPRFKANEWDDIVKLMLRARTELDVGAEATERGEIASWLSAYLAQRPPVDTLEEAATSEYPYISEPHDGRVVLFGPAFKRWLWLTYQERLTNKELGRRLRAFEVDGQHCEPDKVNVELADGKRTTRGVWLLPKGMGA